MIDQNNRSESTLDEFETPDRKPASTDLEEENDFVIDPSGATGHKRGQTRGLVGQRIGGDAFGGHMTRKPKADEPQVDDSVMFNDI